jgi:hypothetical protein
MNMCYCCNNDLLSKKFLLCQNCFEERKILSKTMPKCKFCNLEAPNIGMDMCSLCIILFNSKKIQNCNIQGKTLVTIRNKCTGAIRYEYR